MSNEHIRPLLAAFYGSSPDRSRPNAFMAINMVMQCGPSGAGEEPQVSLTMSDFQEHNGAAQLTPQQHQIRMDAAARLIAIGLKDIATRDERWEGYFNYDNFCFRTDDDCETIDATIDFNWNRPGGPSTVYDFAYSFDRTFSGERVAQWAQGIQEILIDCLKKLLPKGPADADSDLITFRMTKQNGRAQIDLATGDFINNELSLRLEPLMRPVAEEIFAHLADACPEMAADEALLAGEGVTVHFNTLGHAIISRPSLGVTMPQPKLVFLRLSCVKNPNSDVFPDDEYLCYEPEDLLNPKEYESFNDDDDDQADEPVWLDEIEVEITHRAQVYTLEAA